MHLLIYNTLTRKKEELVPAQNIIKIYNCGPTVYDYFHIGNARNFAIFDSLRRFFEYMGNKVIFVQNFTDIDDKIIKRAKEENRDWKEVGEFYINAYFEDADLLGIKRATHHPRATSHIGEMISLIEKLAKKGFAYESGGSVYYDVSKNRSYGKLSNRKISELREGVRIESDENKKNALDFALWKVSKKNEPYWKSPWGNGRPGWHIECSVMAMYYLGEAFDIHSGGIDLVFPHHENEIAQSECAYGKQFAKYWMHNGHLQICGEKMAKSTGNFRYARDILKEYTGKVMRFFLISSHYRSSLNFNESLLKQARNGYNEFCNTFYRLQELSSINGKNDMGNSVDSMRDKFIGALSDDFNTPVAMASLFEFVNELKKVISEKSVQKFSFKKSLKTLFELSSILGIEPEITGVNENVKKLIKEREKARKEKNWDIADNIRTQLDNMGIKLEDTAYGTIPIFKNK